MKSIRRELTLKLLRRLFLLVMVLGALLYLTMRRVLIHDFDSALLAKARSLAALVQQERNGSIELELADEPAPRKNDVARFEYFEIWFDDGQLFKRSKSLGERELPRPSIESSKASFSDLTLPDGDWGRAVGMNFLPPLDPDPETGPPSANAIMPHHPHPRALLVLAQSRQGLDRTLVHLLLSITGCGLLFPLGIALTVRRVVRQGLQANDRLAAEVALLDSHHLEHRFSIAACPTELEPVCRCLNDLLDRIETAFVRERRFSDDIAHELRTPIAELHALVEVALLCPENKAINQKALSESLAISRQMERLVSTLLALARCASGDQPLLLESMDLGQTLEQIWASHQEQAARRALVCTWDVQPDLRVQVDPTMLRSILNNLLSNAVDHCPEGGQLFIQAHAGSGAVHLILENSNDTLREEDLPHLFEPFWQKDKARAAAAHSGLGLSLVGAMGRLLGVTISADLIERERFQVRLDFKRENA